eukprot:scaffold7169_cov107-Cylindrotheca_fusiformis.AAC.3
MKIPLHPSRKRERRHQICRISLRKVLRSLVCLFLGSLVTIVVLAISIHSQDDVIPFIDAITDAGDESMLVMGLRISSERINTSFLPLTAYIEPPLQSGIPLALRINNKTTTVSSLKKVVYPNVKSCLDIPNQLPVHHSISDDDRYGPIMGKLKSLYEIRDDYAASTCPVDADPFLPWIHDVFIDDNYQFVEFVAPNKRRCRTDPNYFWNDLMNLEPQVAIMQSVSVKRLSPNDELLKDIMLPNKGNNNNNINYNQTRYMLTDLDSADDDGRETRFICHYHHVTAAAADGEHLFLGQTLSVYPYNYEYANFLKGAKNPMLSRPTNKKDVNGAHNNQVWNSILHFKCPIPTNVQQLIQQEAMSKKSDDQHPNVVVPGLYLDLVPIRTPARTTLKGYSPYKQDPTFDPNKEWGKHHVLPLVEHSGRWANIPIGCRPPSKSLSSPDQHHKKGTTTKSKLNDRSPDNHQETTNNKEKDKNKKHYLVGCLWASASFKTRRSQSKLDDSTPARLLEWLTYHLYIAGLDHIYIYDNSEAYDMASSSSSSLQPVIDLFPADRVTRIPWKHRVCNNNFKGGERSSQYAAEASCRLRYGPSTEWLISFDTDEYLISNNNNNNNLQDWLKSSVQSGAISKDTHILSLYQTRALPRKDFMEPFYDDDGTTTKECGRKSISSAKCLAKRNNATFLQAYDCESTPLPKPDYGWRAQKQIYRPSFVLNHFVHYTMITQQIHETNEQQQRRIPAFIQRSPYERRVNELTEAFMLHTKTTGPHETVGWEKRCTSTNTTTSRNDKVSCPIGIPWPINVVESEQDEKPSWNQDGWMYNCYQHDVIQNRLAPQLDKILKPLFEEFHKNS